MYFNWRMHLNGRVEEDILGSIIHSTSSTQNSWSNQTSSWFEIISTQVLDDSFLSTVWREREGTMRKQSGL